MSRTTVVVFPGTPPQIPDSFVPAPSWMDDRHAELFALNWDQVRTQSLTSMMAECASVDKRQDIARREGGRGVSPRSREQTSLDMEVKGSPMTWDSDGEFNSRYIHRPTREDIDSEGALEHDLCGAMC